MGRITLAAAGAMVAAAAIGPAVAAAGTTSHAKVFTTSYAACGVAVASSPGDVLCSAKGLRPPSKHFGGDPFAQLGRTGKPKIVPISQNSFGTDKSVTLTAGDSWSNIGVTCTVAASSVKCTNTSGHGFTLSKSSYAPF